jgi:hypothetical protein
MTDEQKRTDEPTDDEREATIEDLEPSDEAAEDVKGGQSSTYFRKEA